MTSALPGLIESRAAIADLVHRYALNIRNGDGAACAELMTDDVEFIVREMDPRNRGEVTVNSHSVGREQTLEHIARPLSGIALCPLIHNLLIELDGREARSTSVMENRTFPAAYAVFGEYHDTFRFDDCWRFSKRVFTKFVERPVSPGPVP